MKKVLSLIALMVWTTFLLAQEQVVTGKVLSQTDGQPIPGVTVQIKGTTTGTITNIDGEYSVKVLPGSTLVVSFVGMKSQEVVVNGGTANFTLEDDFVGLDDVVVIGYGVQKKSLVTGSIASVKGEELSKVTSTNVTEAMQGKASGVVIASSSGQPGSVPSIRIRGTGTNGDPNPLYIIDGLPMSVESTDFLNASDVESVEVLKDAASCAIYGARGANGVVIITTKGGKKDTKTTISYDGYYGVQNVWRKADLMNSKQYMTVVNNAFRNSGEEVFFLQADLDKYSSVNTDWQEEMYNKNAPKQNHSLSMNGGSDKIQYSSSINYFKQEGTLAKGKSDYEKLSGRLNTDSDFGFLAIGTDINLVSIENRGIATNDPNGTGLNQALNMPPVIPVKNADGSWGTAETLVNSVGKSMFLGEITNPVGLLEYQHATTVTRKAIGGLTANFDFGDLTPILKGLSFKSSFSGEFTIQDYKGYKPIFYVDNQPNHHNDFDDVIYQEHKQWTKWNFDNVITYDKTIDIHHVTAIAGSTALKDDYQNIGGSRTNTLFGDFEHAYLDNAKGEMEKGNIYGGYGEHTMASLFGRVNYDLMDRYLISGTIRRDGSSRFGTNNKYGYFPSASFGWVLSKEGFMDDFSDKIDILKLRASWGQNGNENIGDFGYTSVMADNGYVFFGDPQVKYFGTSPSRIANPNLKWETSEQINFGVDLVLLNGKIRTSLDYYIKNTKDWLLEAPIPLTVGNYAPIVNGGDVRNSGFEFDLGYRDEFGKVNFNASINGAFNTNEVTAINNNEKLLRGGSGGFQQNGIIIIKEGESMGSFFGLKTDGIIQNQAEADAYNAATGSKAVPGDMRFVDTNGNGKIDKDLDRVIIGNSNPVFTGSLNIGADAYGFDASLFFYTALGQDIWDASRRFDRTFANYRADYYERWVYEGSTNEFPRVTTADPNGNYSNASDFYVVDGSYLRLKNMTIGYTLPKNVVQKLKVNKVRFYVMGENLLTITGYEGNDPEIGGSVWNAGIDRGVYPQAKTILGGVNVTF